MSGITSLQVRGPVRLALAVLLSLFITVLAIGPAIAQFEPVGGVDIHGEAGALAHLVVSELVTGGASASDEFVEVYNPSADALPLEGLELMYVSASGATVTRKAAWSAGAPVVSPGAHWLIANAAGLYAPLADATYANGLAANGGSVALRIQGATTAVDALGWGNATSIWLEGLPAPAAPAGSSLERLPGGAAGSGQDADDNSADFAVRAIPDPQNAAAIPIPSASSSASPSASASGSASALPSPTASPTITESPTPSATTSATPSPSASGTPDASATPSPTTPPSPSASPSVTPSATPAPGDPISIAEARLLPDGTIGTIRGVALTASDFTDGGGCLVDESAGIAVLLSAGSFARGDQVLVTGSVGDRYAQRTLRSSAAEMTLLGPSAGAAPTPAPTETGAIGEETECELVQLSATIVSSATTLSSGLAFEVDDGSGAVRVLVAPATGIDTSEWVRGAHVALIGVAGQRDSSGTDTAGYRVLPRDAADILEFVPPSTPTPSPSASPSQAPTPSLAGSPTPSPSASQSPTGSHSATPSPSASIPRVISIREARALKTGSVVHVRGVVTLGSRVVDSATAVIQDASAAIVLRLSDGAGNLRRHTLVDVVGVRSTKAGMLTIRVEKAPMVVGSAVDPAAVAIATGGSDERLEARLLFVRGTVTSAPVRSTAGNVAFTIDDGSGPLRVTVFSASGIRTGGIVKGALAEVRGILGQQTTGQQPERGYRLWPRDSADVRVISASAPNAGSGGTAISARTQSSPGSGGLRTGQSGLPRLADDVASGSGAASSPRRPAADGAAVPGPSLGSGAGVPLDGIAAPIGEADAGANLIEPLAARRLSSKYASALLLTALALTVLLGVLAWRTGALGRLRILVERVGNGETPVTDATLETPAGWGTTRADTGERVL